jgi:hypothetical protein
MSLNSNSTTLKILAIEFLLGSLVLICDLIAYKWPAFRELMGQSYLMFGLALALIAFVLNLILFGQSIFRLIKVIFCKDLRAIIQASAVATLVLVAYPAGFWMGIVSISSAAVYECWDEGYQADECPRNW